MTVESPQELESFPPKTPEDFHQLAREMRQTGTHGILDEVRETLVGYRITGYNTDDRESTITGRVTGTYFNIEGTRALQVETPEGDTYIFDMERVTDVHRT